MISGSVPTRFVLFVLVGSLGVLVHLSTLAMLYTKGHVSFVISQTVATITAMTFNFLLNNRVTFRDRQLRGWKIATGLFTFYLACSLGALINISFAQGLLRSGFPWYLAGISGIVMSSFWNYGANTLLTWRRVKLPENAGNGKAGARVNEELRGVVS